MNDRPAALSYLAPVFRVSDLARSIHFYREQLGFELDFSYEDFYASVHRDGCYIHLRCAAPAPCDQSAFERAEHLDACAVISAAARLASELAAAGAPFPSRCARCLMAWSSTCATPTGTSSASFNRPRR